jgi:hypothetical protein
MNLNSINFQSESVQARICLCAAITGIEILIGIGLMLSFG